MPNVELAESGPEDADDLQRIEVFLARAASEHARRANEPERVLATVLFTDLVGSTSKAVELGPKWQHLLREHNQRIRRELARHSGREIDTAGDGFFSSGFDSARRSLRVRDPRLVADLDLDVRVGVHTGECDVVDGKLSVYTASRHAQRRRRKPAKSSSPAPSATWSPARNRVRTTGVRDLKESAPTAIRGRRGMTHGGQCFPSKMAGSGTVVPGVAPRSQTGGRLRR
jgi:hypothetical protein